MLRPTRSVDQRCGTERRMGDRRRGILPAATESLSATHVATAYIMVVAVLAADALLPLGFAVSCLYLIPLAYLALWSTPKQSSPVLLLAVVCMVLTVAGFFVSAPGPFWIGMANRAFAIMLIGITTLLSVLRKRTEDDVKVLRGLLPICSYCKKIRDDSGYWQQVERYIAARSHADFSHGLCPDCGPKHFPEAFGLQGGKKAKESNRQPSTGTGRSER
jgi:hypothetical protein